jgi:hypothetical protein
MTAGWTIAGTATRAENTGVVTFPTASGGNWGTITHMGIFDASTVGNLLFHGALTTTRIVNDTDTIEFAATALGVTLT